MAVNPGGPPVEELRPAGAPSAAPSPDRFDADGAVRDAVQAAVAVLEVTAALARLLAERAAIRRRTVVARLPRPGRAPEALAHPVVATARALAGAADRVVPAVARGLLARLDVPALVREFVDLDRLVALVDVDAVADRVDVGRVLDRIDLDAVVARVDLDRAVARVDLDAAVGRVDVDAVADRVDVGRVLARVDLDGVVDRVDLDRAVARVDLDGVVDRVDLDRAVARVDLDAVVERVDLDRAVARVDLDGVVERVDLDRAVARVDLDAVVERVDLDRAVARVDLDAAALRMDLAGLARYVVEVIDLPGLLRASTGSVTLEVVRSVRDQGADADRAVERVVDRLLRRHARRTTAGDGVRGPAGPEASS
ncbi:hypothetical protein [Geodermatophilus sp. SYSU D00698]